MKKVNLFILVVGMWLSGCTTHRLPPFANQQWHVDAYSGNAVSTSGLELAFGSEWMIKDTTLLQTPEHIADYPKLSEHLYKGIQQFPEISVDSILFYQPDRGLLFTIYHQVKSFKPTSEIYLYDETSGVYSKEYARIFGQQYTYVDDTGWEKGPIESVYSNAKYIPRDKRVVLLQRIPYNGKNIAVFQIWATTPKRGKWWEEYPRGTFMNIDLGNTNNIETISNLLQWSRNLAVENLRLSRSSAKEKY